MEERIILNQRYTPCHPKMETLTEDAMSGNYDEKVIKSMKNAIHTHFDNTKRDSISMLQVKSLEIHITFKIRVQTNIFLFKYYHIKQVKQGSMISTLLLFDSFKKWYVLQIQPNPRCSEESPEGQEWIFEATAALKVARNMYSMDSGKTLSVSDTKTFYSRLTSKKFDQPFTFTGSIFFRPTATSPRSWTGTGKAGSATNGVRKTAWTLSKRRGRTRGMW